MGKSTLAGVKRDGALAPIPEVPGQNVKAYFPHTELPIVFSCCMRISSKVDLLQRFLKSFICQIRLYHARKNRLLLPLAPMKIRSLSTRTSSIGCLELVTMPLRLPPYADTSNAGLLP